MNKIWVLFLATSSSFFGFEKLDSKYCIEYGNPEANVRVIEYFSFSCPKCMEFFMEEFPIIKKSHIETGIVSWTFHPDPADLLTLQAMICLERLLQERKIPFLEAMMETLAKLGKNDHGCELMQEAMKILENPIPELSEIDFLKTTGAFNRAYEFVTQKDVVKVIPSIEIDGNLYKEYPSIALLNEHIVKQKRSL